MYTAAPQIISNPTNSDCHYNYAEVELSAEGYKNLRFSCRLSGNNSKTLPVYILVSADGGNTWVAGSIVGSTGSSWSNFNEVSVPLAVDNQKNVKIRTLIGYDAGATGDMYMNSFKVTGESLSSEHIYFLTTTAVPQNSGYVTMSPVGPAAVGGTSVSLTAKNFSGYGFKEWRDADGHTLSSVSPYVTTIDDNIDIYAVFVPVETFSLTVNKKGDGARWGEIHLSPEPVDGQYDAGTEVTLTVVPNHVTNFLTWEDNSADLSRVITVNNNMEVTAFFDIIPFIVAWDFNNDKNTSRGNRPADYAFSSDNTGTMFFYQGPNCADTNWGSGQVSFGGRQLWAARRYTDYNKEEQIPRAFVATFSVKDYDKVNIHSFVSANNGCVRQRQLLQLSTTGKAENYKTLKTLTLEDNPSSDWKAMDYELDTKDIDGMVYIRWIEDETSDFFDGGNHSGTEGFYLADVIIFAEQNNADDTEAPVLISSSPAANGTGISSRGNIVLNFNERVKQGSGIVTLNNEALQGAYGSKSVVFAYHGLSYGTTYTLHIGENAIVDYNGNAFPVSDITFSVTERPSPTARLYDAVVAQDGTGNYLTVQAAIDAAPTNRKTPWLIFVKNGEYEELVTIPQNKSFIHLIGQDKEKVVIKFFINNGGSNDKGYEYSTNNPASKTYGKQAVVQVNATDFYTENITYFNRWGVEQQSGPMGNAMSSRADRQAFYNCKFRSYQDTWYTDVRKATDRQYVNKCLIEGAVDFYYGAGNNYIENSTFRLARIGSVIVAPSHKAGTKWGYVMVNNIIDGKGGSNKLGRAWQDRPIAVWINTTLKTSLAPEGWSEWHIAPKLFAEYNTMDEYGLPVDLNNRRTTYKVDSDKLNAGETSPVKRQAVLSTEEAAAYTYEAVTAGDDDWNPRMFYEPVEAPSNLILDGSYRLTWYASPYAICYIIIDSQDQVIGMTTDNYYQTDGKSLRYSVKAVNEYGSLSDSSTVDTTTNILVVQKENYNRHNDVYNLYGHRLDAVSKGLNIVVEHHTDNKNNTKKIFIK